MKMNKGYRPLLALVYGLCLLLSAGGVQAAASVARVASVVGNADVKRAADGHVVPLRFKSEIFLDDVVMTDLGSQVKLLLKDSSIIKVGPRSKMKIGKLLLGTDDQSNTTINLIKGRLRSIVGRRLGGTSSYEVRTSVAVAGVRGTIFDGVHIPAADNGGTGRDISAFRTVEGLVLVGSTDPDIPGTVEVEPDTFTVIQAGEPPSGTEPIGAGENLEQKARAKVRTSDSDKSESGDDKKAAGDEQKETSGSGEEASNGQQDTESVTGETETTIGTADEAAGGAELETVEGEQVPEMELGDNSISGQEVAEEVDPETRVESLVVVPEVEVTGRGDSTVIVVDDPSTESDGQLNTVTEPAVDAVSVPLQIIIPTP